MAQKPTAQAKTENMIVIPTDKILADDDWNSRSGNYREGDTREDASEWKEFRENISEVGQEQPVIVTRGEKDTYRLVAGFRRFHAIQETEAMTKTKIGVKAIVQELDDAEAALLNARENIARQDLMAPDLCFAVGRARDSAKKNGKFDNLSRFSVTLGLKQPWVFRLVTIWDKLEKDVFEHWRKVALVKLPVLTMQDIAETVEKDKQFEVYEKTLKEKIRAQRLKEPSKKTSVDRAINKARKLGTMLGLLEAEAHVTRPAGGYDWTAICKRHAFDVLVEDEDTPKNREQISDAARSAWSDAFANFATVLEREREAEKLERAKTTRKAATA
jgi:ParB/RepB/Spo0J family partition protein